MQYSPPTRTSTPPGEPVLVYDGECPFCCASAYWIARHARIPVRVITFDDLHGGGAGGGLMRSLPRSELVRSAHFVTAEGIEYHGGESVTRALRLTRLAWLGRALDLPGIAAVRDLAYLGVDRARPLLSRFVRGQCRG